jgi:hypothetical protein
MQAYWFFLGMLTDVMLSFGIRRFKHWRNERRRAQDDGTDAAPKERSPEDQERLHP